MKDYRDNMSRDVKFDDTYQWQSFVRDTKLPRDAFKRHPDPDSIVFLVVMLCLLVGLVAVHVWPT